MFNLAGKKRVTGIAAVCMLVSAICVYAGKRDEMAEVESVRKDGIITITSSEKPDKEK